MVAGVQNFVSKSAPAVSAAWLNRVDEATLNAASFGAVGDGVTDDTAAILAGIAAAATLGISTLQMEDKIYAISQTLVVGNGSASAYSTINNVVVKGVGAQFVRLGNAASPLNTVGTIFKWIGAANGTMAKIAGPSIGNAFCDCAFNGAGVAGICLDVYSNSRGYFGTITCDGFTNRGVRFTTVVAESIGGKTESISSASNIIDNLEFNVVGGAIGLDLDGYPGSGANGWDATRNSFRGIYGIINLANGVGIRLGFCDQNTFGDTVFTGTGAPSGTPAAVLLAGTTSVPSGFIFPQNNRFIGNVDWGQGLSVISSATPGNGNDLGYGTVLSTEVVPAWPATQYSTFRTVEPLQFPIGGFVSDGGLPILERGLRNKLNNFGFRRNTRGLSGTLTAAPQRMSDSWYLTFDGAVTGTWTITPFVLGQTSVPYEPKYYLSLVVTAASGATFMYFGQKIPHVETLQSRQTMLSAWLQCAAGTLAVSDRIEQFFGTGGSPSATAASNGAAVTITTAWQRYRFQQAQQSISGKTLGTNGDDSVNVLFGLPINTTFTFNIALPQFEAGLVDTAVEVRPEWIDEILCAQQLQKVGSGAVGTWTSATACALAARLGITMRAPPTITTDSSSITVLQNGAAGLAAAAGASLISSDKYGLIWSATGFAGATAGQSAMCEGSNLYASAEL